MLLKKKERSLSLLSSKLFAKKTKKMAEEPPTSIRGEATSPGRKPYDVKNSRNEIGNADKKRCAKHLI